MEDRIGDRGAGRDDADLAESLDAERRDLGVFLGDEDHVDRFDVGVDGNVVPALGSALRILSRVIG